MNLCQQSNALLFNMLSRLVITFLPKSKCLLISWLQSPSAVIWSPTLQWPNQTLLWTSMGLRSISLESLLIAAIISSYSCNPKPRYTSRSLHCNHQASSGMCIHTHTHTHAHTVPMWENSILLGRKPTSFPLMESGFTRYSKQSQCLPNSISTNGLPRWH